MRRKLREKVFAAVIAVAMALTPAIVFADQKSADDPVGNAAAGQNHYANKLMVTAAPAHFEQTKVELFVRGTTKLHVIGGKGKLKGWKSSKKKVATVSKKGVVKAKKAGKTTISVKKGKKKIKCTIVVVPNCPYLQSAPDYQAITGAKMKKHVYVAEEGADGCLFKYSKSKKKKYVKKLKAWGFRSIGNDIYMNDALDYVGLVKKKKNLIVVYGTAGE